MGIQRKERYIPAGDPESLREGDGTWKDHPSRQGGQVLVSLLPQSAKSSRESQFSPFSNGPFAPSASQHYEN